MLLSVFRVKKYYSKIIQFIFKSLKPFLYLKQLLKYFNLLHFNYH
jgi:hypothetical protein